MKMKKVYLLVLLVFSIYIAGFAQEPSGNVVFNRPYSFAGFAAKIQIIINQHIQFVLNNKEYCSLQLPPGEYLVSLRNHNYEYLGTHSYIINVEPEKQNIFTCSAGEMSVRKSDDTEIDFDEFDEVLEYTDLRSSNE